MTKITYTFGEEVGTIYWVAAEQFSELAGKKFILGEMEATQIEKRKDLTITAKILLSAVAGAIIQRLIDTNIPVEVIFNRGTFIIEG